MKQFLILIVLLASASILFVANPYSLEASALFVFLVLLLMFEWSQETILTGNIFLHYRDVDSSPLAKNFTVSLLPKEFGEQVVSQACYFAFAQNLVWARDYETVRGKIVEHKIYSVDINWLTGHRVLTAAVSAEDGKCPDEKKSYRSWISFLLAVLLWSSFVAFLNPNVRNWLGITLSDVNANGAKNIWHVVYAFVLVLNALCGVRSLLPTKASSVVQTNFGDGIYTARGAVLTNEPFTEIGESTRIGAGDFLQMTKQASGGVLDGGKLRRVERVEALDIKYSVFAIQRHYRVVYTLRVVILAEGDPNGLYKENNVPTFAQLKTIDEALTDNSGDYHLIYSGPDNDLTSAFVEAIYYLRMAGLLYRMDKVIEIIRQASIADSNPNVPFSVTPELMAINDQLQKERDREVRFNIAKDFLLKNRKK